MGHNSLRQEAVLDTEPKVVSCVPPLSSPCHLLSSPSLTLRGPEGDGEREERGRDDMAPNGERSDMAARFLSVPFTFPTSPYRPEASRYAR